jgi:exodeoxyribonuclease V alpha subunit
VCRCRASCGVPALGEDGEAIDYVWPELEAWLAALRQSRAVSGDGDHTPIVLDADGRVYLTRYFRYEQTLAASIRRRTVVAGGSEGVDATLRGHLDALFPPLPDGTLDLQKVAALVAIRSNFAVVTGGPGTGKTTTVARIVAALQLLARARGGAPLSILLLAPTGKAAARLSEAIGAALGRLPLDETLKATITTEAFTIHRALRYEPRNPTQFAHNADNPLLADVVIVDEASMVDVALMSKLVDAVRDDARFILLGDRHQLASVEAGAILGDICSRPGTGRRFSLALATWCEAVAGVQLPAESVDAEASALADCVVELQRTWRFSGEIARLTAAIFSGRPEAVRQILRGSPEAATHAVEGSVEGAEPEVVYHDSRSLVELRRQYAALIVERYRHFLRAGSAEEALAAASEFRVLCVFRQGPWGVEKINAWIEDELEGARLIRRRTPWYHGRLLLITRNDYEQRLFNGDVGLVWQPDPATPAMVCFATTDGAVRTIPPSRLPPHETVFAMTVTKSQGSEFQHVLLVLPETPNALATRELLYTAVSRARRRIDIFGSIDVVDHAVSTPIRRDSGLADALWTPPAASLVSSPGAGSPGQSSRTTQSSPTQIKGGPG